MYVTYTGVVAVAWGVYEPIDSQGAVKLAFFKHI